jgi:hypothetical protein
VTPRSGKKVWWKCKKGHEWKTGVKNRARGNQCPFCKGKRASKDYNFQAVHPGLAREWHPTKNGTLTPGNVTPCSGKKVWWKCKKGHEWQAQIKARNSGSGCSICYGKGASPGYNLEVVNPTLAKEWHPKKNGTLTPENVTPSSGKKVWWKCKKGHEWETYISNRAKGYHCPYCKGKKASKDYNFQIVHPGLAREWHPTKNDALTPEDVTPGSDKKAWWKCKNGHEWKTTVNKRSNGKGCPYCCGKRPSETHNLEVVNPVVSKQWHPTKNGGLTPRDVTPNSGKKAWWICKNGHEWQAQIRSRNSGYGCPICSGVRASPGYNLEVVNPTLAKEWHPTKNGKLTPRDFTPKSDKKIWWVCKKGHEWKTTIGKRTFGQGCPNCVVFKVNKGNFKKGHIPASFKGVYKPRIVESGSYVVTTLEEKRPVKKDGKIVGEKKRVTGYARYLYGLDRIPDGWIIWHVDGDPLNNDIDNLECMSREEEMRRMRERKGVRPEK